MEMRDLPQGLSMALAKQPEAMQKFCALSYDQQCALIDQTHQVRSKKEMNALVKQLKQS